MGNVIVSSSFWLLKTEVLDGVGGSCNQELASAINSSSIAVKFKGDVEVAVYSSLGLLTLSLMCA